MPAARFLGLCLSLSLLAVFTPGCYQSLPPKTDVKDARAALTAALNAWQEGQPPEKLRERTPPVDFRDTYQDQGSKLKKYEIEKEETSGLSAKFTVKLSLSDKAGKSSTKTMVYNADTGPAIVIRQDTLSP